MDEYTRIYHLETENVEWLLFRETREKGWRLMAAGQRQVHAQITHTRTRQSALGFTKARPYSRKLKTTELHYLMQVDVTFNVFFFFFSASLHIFVLRERREVDSMTLVKNLAFSLLEKKRDLPFFLL